MRWYFHAAVIVLLATAVDLHAQNFDGDSIYYTPIPHPTVKEKKSAKRIFQDTVSAQRYVTYFFNLQVGTLIGCSDCDEAKEVTLTSSTTHGVALGKKLRAGVGIGLDTYENWKTMPLFGSVSWDVFGTKNTNALFVQVKYGWSESWINNHDDAYGFTDTGGGRMADIQLGYRIKHRDMNIAFSVGTKFQRVYSYFEYPNYLYRNGEVVQGPSSTTTIQQDMSRLSIGVTIGWR